MNSRSNPRPVFRGRVGLVCAALLLGAVWLLTGCQPVSDSSRGVELVLSSTSPAPSMTFELRFDQPMVSSREVGSQAARSPLLVSPSLPGEFVWLSTRSGVYTPSEPLALDTRYALTLRSGLAAADGRLVEAVLHKVLVLTCNDRRYIV